MHFPLAGRSNNLSSSPQWANRFADLTFHAQGSAYGTTFGGGANILSQFGPLSWYAVRASVHGF
jgi:hypothetical protein